MFHWKYKELACILWFIYQIYSKSFQNENWQCTYIFVKYTFDLDINHLKYLDFGRIGSFDPSRRWPQSRSNMTSTKILRCFPTFKRFLVCLSYCPTKKLKQWLNSKHQFTYLSDYCSILQQYNFRDFQKGLRRWTLRVLEDLENLHNVYSEG